MLSLNLFGNCHIQTATETLEPAPSKLMAMLYYLAYEAQWVSRDQLALLFWPDSESKAARSKLRQLINRAKTLSFIQDLEIEDQRLRWVIPTDIKIFKDALAKQNYMQVIETYAGLLLKNFNIKNAGAFDAWLEFERNDLHLSWQEAALRASESLAKTDRQSDAAILLRKIWNLSDFDESTLQSYMRTAYLSGYKETALSVFNSFSQQLQTEYGVEPSEESLALAEAINANGALSEQIMVKPKQAKMQNLAELFGRQSELKDLSALLINDKCRLLVLTGLGGVGKTRLSLELAKKNIAKFEHGTYFVPLKALVDPNEISSSIAHALDFSFYGNKDPKEQLISYLREKQTLLLIDNLDHVLQGADLLTDLLEQAPKLKIVVSSREKPDLPDVWVYPLKGLTFQSQDSDAAKLFIHHAKKQSPSFNAEQNNSSIHDLCHLVEGLPLALELSAVWVKDLNVEELVTEIRANLNFLKREGIAQHDSMRAVFEHSWGLLSPEQQIVIAKLSVFQGGFSKEAALKVAEANAYLILSLISRSLIRKEASGYFGFHELLKQFATLKADDLLDIQSLKDAHAKFFSQQVAITENSETQKEQALSVVERDFGNISAAWRHSTEQKKIRNLENLIEPISRFVSKTNRIKSGLNLLNYATQTLTLEDTGTAFFAVCFAKQGKLNEAIENHELASQQLQKALKLLDKKTQLQEIAQANISYALALKAFGDYRKAHELLSQTEGIYKAQGNTLGLGHCYINMGNLYYHQSDYEEAKSCYEQGLVLADGELDSGYLSQAFNNLGLISLDRGEFQSAETLLLQARDAHQKTNNLNLEASTLSNLGLLYLELGNMVKAKEAFETSIEIAQDIGNKRILAASNLNLSEIFTHNKDYKEAKERILTALKLMQDNGEKRGVAFCLSALSTNALLQANIHEAESYALESLNLKLELKDKYGLSLSLCELGNIYLQQNSMQDARDCFLTALNLAEGLQTEPIMIEALLGYAKTLVETETLRKQIFKLVIRHSSSKYMNREEAKSLLEMTIVDIESTDLNLTEVTAQLTQAASASNKHCLKVLAFL